MVKLTDEQKRDMEKLRTTAKIWLRKYPWVKYKRIRSKLCQLADEYESLDEFVFSDWWINDLKERAGIKKVSQKQEHIDKKILNWLKERQGNIFHVFTCTERVRAQWEKFSKKKPSRNTLINFRRKYKITLTENPATKNQDAWVLPKE